MSPEERIEALRDIMRDKGWDAVIITGSDPHGSEYVAPRWHQVEWLSGYTGEGDLVITLDHAGLWTDTRYFILAGQQLPGTGIELHKMRVPEQVPMPRWLAETAFPDKDRDVMIAVDGQSVTFSFIQNVLDAFIASGRDADGIGGCEGVTIFNEPDLLDMLWADRPGVPSNPIESCEAFAGQGREDKLLWLRGEMLRLGCDAILVPALDEIAWLLNVRGSDIEYNPLVISYLLVTINSAKWLVIKDPYANIDPRSEACLNEMRSAGIEVCNYDDLAIETGGLVDPERGLHVFVDGSSLNYDAAQSLELQGCRLKFGTSPVQLRKAVKNPVEIEGMKKAHLKDGIAMELFLYWLETSLYQGYTITEWDAAQKLHGLRASIPEFRGESFETISAYGQNAALPHYSTPAEGSAQIKAEGLYLCDSGGQYVFGTTDITRTVPLGRCSELEREDYTLVLKGHICLAMAEFPAGTAGCQIDALAREPLWSHKRNFGHGTGHGVGCWLGVHEGPQDIRQNFNQVPLAASMITSDEPGIYRERKWGVRHENLLLCIADGRNEFGSWLHFEPLTLCHFDTSALVPELLGDSEREWLNAYNAKVYRELGRHLPADVSEWLRIKTLPL